MAGSPITWPIKYPVSAIDQMSLERKSYETISMIMNIIPTENEVMQTRV